MIKDWVVLKQGVPPLPEDLMLARDKGDVLFIVGAGASYAAPSHLPDFKGLVAEIYTEIDPSMSSAIAAVRAGTAWDAVTDPLDDRQRTELKFFDRGEYDVVLGMLERRIDGDPGQASTLRTATDKVLKRTTTPNGLHTSLVRLGQRFGKTLLVTTNFDRLLGVAAKRAKYSDRSFALGEIPNPSRRTDFTGILHIHGKLSLGKDPASGLILTDQDFGDFYLRRHIVTSFLYDAARIFHLVLVGYSANDSPVRYLLNAIAADERHFVDLKPRYAFVGCDTSDQRTPVEWSSRGITPIPYDPAHGHLALGQVLEEWANILPEKKNAALLRKKLAQIAATDFETDVGKAAQSMLRYVVRRSTSIERNDVLVTLSNTGASPRWVTFVNQLILEGRGV
ncbi:SIR2 family protein [Sinorhizobium meliloti]|uniref:SIR2 family protein n=1 Tax=Rhizobium meliloti TaxID=382 RepID=UPI003D9FE19F